MYESHSIPTGPPMQNLHGNLSENSCTLCVAAAYCCGAVTPRVIAALLGRFLPRLGPLANASGPFFCLGILSTRPSANSECLAVSRSTPRQHLGCWFAGLTIEGKTIFSRESLQPKTTSSGRRLLQGCVEV